MATTYDVYARKAHPDPLAYIGSVEVESGYEVGQVSLATYGPEGQWLEMVAVPQQDVIVVFPEKGEEA